MMTDLNPQFMKDSRTYKIFRAPTCKEGTVFMMDPEEVTKSYSGNYFPRLRSEPEPIMIMCHPNDYEILKVRLFGQMNVLFPQEGDLAQETWKEELENEQH